MLPGEAIRVSAASSRSSHAPEPREVGAVLNLILQLQVLWGGVSAPVPFGQISPAAERRGRRPYGLVKLARRATRRGGAGRNANALASSLTEC